MVFKHENGGGKMSVKEVARQLKDSKMSYKVKKLNLTQPRLISTPDPNDDKLIGEEYSTKIKQAERLKNLFIINEKSYVGKDMQSRLNSNIRQSTLMAI